MGSGSKYDYWDRADLLDAVKDTYMKLHGKKPEPGLYDELESKALEGELSDLKGELIKREMIKKNDLDF